MARLFADTYALIELLKGNPNYEDYSQTYLVAIAIDGFFLPGVVERGDYDKVCA